MPATDIMLAAHIRKADSVIHWKHIQAVHRQHQNIAIYSSS